MPGIGPSSALTPGRVNVCPEGLGADPGLYTAPPFPARLQHRRCFSSSEVGSARWSIGSRAPDCLFRRLESSAQGIDAEQRDHRGFAFRPKSDQTRRVCLLANSCTTCVPVRVMCNGELGTHPSRLSSYGCLRPVRNDVRGCNEWGRRLGELRRSVGSCRGRSGYAGRLVRCDSGRRWDSVLRVASILHRAGDPSRTPRSFRRRSGLSGRDR
jgi:hypothetical protein